MRENWKPAVVVTALGLLLVGVGALFADSWSDAASGVLIEFGAGIGLVAAIVWLERRFLQKNVREIAAAEAREKVREVVVETEERISRLEQLAKHEAEERFRRQAAQQAETDSLFAEGLTASSLGGVLLASQREQLFSEDFGVRAGDSPHAPILYFCVLAHRDEVQMVFVGLEPFRFSGQTMQVEGAEIPIPDTTPSVAWIPKEPPEDLFGEILELLNRMNVPSEDFSLAKMAGWLRDSVRVARESRNASGGSARRLRGKVKLLVNAGWVLTSSGLESVAGNQHFDLESSYAKGPTGLMEQCVPHVDVPERVEGEEDSLSDAGTVLSNAGLLEVHTYDPDERRRRDLAAQIRELDEPI